MVCASLVFGNMGRGSGVGVSNLEMSIRCMKCGAMWTEYAGEQMRVKCWSCGASSSTQHEVLQTTIPDGCLAVWGDEMM